MKKLMTLTLTAAVATSMIDVPTVMAEETTVTTPVSAYTDMKLMEVKDGQFDENGEAYFTLTIEQEGFYRLVGDNIDQYKTAITQNKEQLENATFQSASKLRTLKKGTYYVKVKGTPNATYHFKFAERTFDMNQEWPISKKIAIPYYMEREAYATLELKDDKYIRFMGHSATSDKAVKALSLKNVTTGETYIAKKISNYAFSSNAPDGTYHVDLVYTDEFKKNPIVGKLELRYTLAEHLPFNERVSSKTTAGETFTLNLEKDTKIHFTLMDPKGKKGNNQRFSIYDDQHRLVKRVHIQPDQSSRSFTYTVKKGRYSVTLSHNVELNTLIDNGSDANSAFKLKNNSLVYKATGKVVKGYQVYKEKLYKDGKLTTGRIKYGKVPNMKLYRNGVLEKGIYISKGYKYAFKDGSLIQGDYEYEDETGLRTNALFKDGVLTHLLELKNVATRLYDNGSLHKGRYVFNMYDGLGSRSNIDLRLFINGKLATGYEKATYNDETYMFKDGEVRQGKRFYYDGKVYVSGKPKSGYVQIDDTLYYKHKLFTGVNNKRYYENGIHQYYLITKAYEDKVQEAADLKAQIGQQPNEVIAKLLKEKVEAVFADLDDRNKQEHIYDDYGNAKYDDVGKYYENSSNIAKTIVKQLETIDEVTKQLDGAAEETHQLLQQRIENIR